MEKDEDYLAFAGKTRLALESDRATVYSVWEE